MRPKPSNLDDEKLPPRQLAIKRLQMLKSALREIDGSKTRHAGALARMWEHLCEVRRKAEEARIWEALGFADLNEVVEAETGKPLSAWEATARGRIADQAAKANVETTLSPHTHADAQFAHQTQPNRARRAGISRRTQQKLDKLARKRPDLLAKVRRGELSCHGACKLAGWVKPRLCPHCGGVIN